VDPTRVGFRYWEPWRKQERSVPHSQGLSLPGPNITQGVRTGDQPGASLWSGWNQCHASWDASMRRKGLPWLEPPACPEPGPLLAHLWGGGKGLRPRSCWQPEFQWNPTPPLIHKPTSWFYVIHCNVEHLM
jgi:hypothetical protein